MMAMNVKFRMPKWLKSVRYTLAAVNAVFLLTGFLLLLVGIIVLVRYSEYDELITARFFTISGFVIATAVITFLGSALGFYAAISQQFYFVVGYIVLMLIILVFEISIIIVCFGLSGDAPSEIKSSMAQTLVLYRSRIEITRAWDELQREFECCGVNGRFDWISNQIPISCCHIVYGTIYQFECNTANAYTIGCASTLGDYLAQQAYAMAMTTLVATCILVILILIGGYLAWRSKFEQIELES